jgi:alpha,alpha-trehalase
MARAARAAPLTRSTGERARTGAFLLACVALGCAAPRPAPSAAPPDPLAPARVARLRAFIHDTWPTLTRTLADLPRAAVDPKFPPPPGGRWPVYLPGHDDPAALADRLRALLSPTDLATLDLRVLPPDPASIHVPGLLFLPRPYVVPGGRFNEMYGWDSAFIVLGLLRDGGQALARDIVDNFLFEVREYGGVLNANRTYYLTRSQPPLLSAMVLAVFHATGDRAWLARAREALAATHAHWTAPPHLLPAIGLSRYFDHGEGPAPEVVAGERDANGQTHYDRVRASFRARNDPALDRFYDRTRDALTPLFYAGDRAMRESGFDPTGRFGPFGAETTQMAPVCLNTLLYRTERDLAEIDGVLGRPRDAARWDALARDRRARIETLLWDESAGLYFDYDVEAGRRHPYPFATTFWPLAAGLAAPERAARVHANLGRFERPGGVLTSTAVTGAQWDAPFGWAPLELFAVEGLRRAGFPDDAARIARAFVSMLIEDFERRGTLLEKYDIERRTSVVAGALRFGYTSNEIGFGWTNGVALELLAGLGL